MYSKVKINFADRNTISQWLGTKGREIAATVLRSATDPENEGGSEKVWSFARYCKTSTLPLLTKTELY